MKTFKCLALAIFLSTYGCKNNEITPAGTWKVTSFTINTPEIPEENIREFEQDALSTVYSLKKDSTAEISSDVFPQAFKGKWAYNDSSKTISIRYTDQVTDEAYQVTHLDDTSMSWFAPIPDINGDISVRLTRQKD
jgi:hypothetical protein